MPRPGRTSRLLALRAALRVAGQLDRGARWLVRWARDEASTEEAHALTEERFARMHDYRQAWHREAGLLGFEERAIEEGFPSPPAHVLVHAAGGGREAHALLDRGYRVTAAEPVAALAAAARDALVGRATVVVAGLESVEPEALRGPFDAVIVGWGGFGHILTPDARVSALAALRRVCPGGPVLVSWGCAPPRGLRGSAPSVAAIAGRAEPASTRAVTHFGLFHAVIDEATLRREAARAGYDVIRVGSHADDGYPNALLRPAG